MKPDHAWAGKFRELGTHLAVATVTAAVVLVLAHGGALNWLESLSLRVTAAFIPQDNGRPRLASNPDVPVILAVGSGMYETVFRQTSPLNRAALAEVLESIDRLNPRLVAVDLDLSPGPGGAPDAGAQAQLDQTLIRLARQHAGRYVLTAPVPVDTQALRQEKFAWMQRMCSAGFVFAHPYLTLSQSAVLRYDATEPGLGLAAARLWDPRSGTESKALCDQVAGGIGNAVFLSTLSLAIPAGQADDYGRQRPLEPTFLRSSASEPHALETTDAQSLHLDLTGRAVFVGATFEPNDAFLTAWGERSGVAIHAGIFASELHPISPLSHRIAFLIDILLGTLAGALFHASWHRYAVADRNIAGGAANRLGPYLAARAWLIGNFALLFLISLSCLVLAGFLFRFNLWVNPGPIILAIFFKNLLGSRASLKHTLHEAHDPGTDAGSRSSWVAWADVVLVSPFLLLAIYYLVQER